MTKMDWERARRRSRVPVSYVDAVASASSAPRQTERVEPGPSLDLSRPLRLIPVEAPDLRQVLWAKLFAWRDGKASFDTLAGIVARVSSEPGANVDVGAELLSARDFWKILDEDQYQALAAKLAEARGRVAGGSINASS
jgi:hypothetical protein